MAILGIHVSFRGWRVHAVISSTEIFLFPQSSWSCKQRFRPWIYQQKFRPERTNLSWKRPRYVCVYIYRDMSYMYNMFNIHISLHIYMHILYFMFLYIYTSTFKNPPSSTPRFSVCLSWRARCFFSSKDDNEKKVTGGRNGSGGLR